VPETMHNNAHACSITFTFTLFDPNFKYNNREIRTAEYLVYYGVRNANTIHKFCVHWKIAEEKKSANFIYPIKTGS
jgi:hypothetical protein